MYIYECFKNLKFFPTLEQHVKTDYLYFNHFWREKKPGEPQFSSAFEDTLFITFITVWKVLIRIYQKLR